MKNAAAQVEKLAAELHAEDVAADAFTGSLADYLKSERLRERLRARNETPPEPSP